MAYEQANDILNQISQSIDRGRAASQAVVQGAPASILPAVTTPSAPVQPQADAANPGSIGALGGGLLHGLLNGAKWVGKIFESGSTGVADAAGAIHNILGAHQQQNMDGTTSTNYPAQQRNFWQDLHDIWSKTDEHVSSDAWHGSIPNAGKLPGTNADIADVADFGAQMISPIDYVTAPLSIGSKLAAEGLARVPGIAGKVAAYGDKLAADTAKAASEAHAASMPDPTEIPHMTDEQMQHMASIPHVDDAYNQNINDRAGLSGGYVPPEAPKASQMLDDFISSIKPNIVEKGTPPINNPVMLHKYVSDALHSAGVEMTKTELNMMPYKAQVDFAHQLQPQVMQGIYKKEAQLRGINFDDLFNRAKQEAAPAVAEAPQLPQELQQIPHSAFNAPRDTNGLPETLNSTPATSSLVNPGQSPNMMDQLSMMLHGNGNTDLAALSHDPEVVNPGQSSRFGQTRNEQPGQFSDIPSAPSGSGAGQAAGAATAQNGYAGMSKGEMFQAMLKDSLKRMVGDRVSGVINKMGFGSGLNLMNDTSRNIALNGKAAEALNTQKLTEFFTDYAKQHLDKGVTLKDMQYAVDAHEAGQPVPTTMQSFIDDLTKFQNEGVAGVHGGLHAEQAAGIAPNITRPNYIHLSIDPRSIPKDDPAGILNQMKTVGMGYAKDRKFDTAAAAREAGYGVRDPISAVFDRLNQSQKDLNHIKTYTDLKHEGYRNGEVLSPEGFAAKKNVAPDQAKDYKQFTNNADPQHPLNGSYLKDGLHQYTTTQSRMPWSSANIPIISKVLSKYDSTSNLYKHLSLYNGMVHNHNTFGNALISFGLHPKNYMDAEATLHGNTALGGTATPAMQDALHYANKTGALGNDSHVSSFDKISRIVDPSFGKELKGRFADMQDSTLWNREKALRLGVFKQAFEHAQARGMDREAAAHVARDVTNKHMVDYSSNNLSTFEREIMTRLDPYYKWHKGNYSLQAKNLVNNPAALARQALVNHGRNLVQKMVTGQGQDQNIGGAKEHNLSFQFPLSNGTRVNYDPYLSSDEPFKIMDDSLGHFLYSRQNPILREIEAQLTNQKFTPTPGTAPVGKSYMSGDKYAIRNGADSAGTQILDSIKHAGSTFATSGEGAIGSAIASMITGNDPKYPKTPVPMQLSLDALGGFAGSSPTSQGKIDAQQHLQNQHLANQEYAQLQRSQGYDPKTSATKHQMKLIELKYGVKALK